ncbi:ABC transporter substrate-binding protein [Microbacterium marinilacus]|uniref:SsuA/THI5-like domain-containing protein n=1 Tax=Microbacterium marinilacus TaxID=415209 RepID=A0ABP7BKB3_9MICO|nr:ABC transporter substrate-binding protein [Microbacterium marinilacus]MBY0689757.1 ABC transporter substrate-binding protein [Microbacterium marinilacus]
MTSPFPRDRRARLRAVVGTGLAAAALALSACADGGGAASSGGDPGSGDPVALTYVSFLPLESLTFAPEMMADAGGFFEKHGLDVTLEPVNGTPVAIQSVLGGAAQVTRLSTVDSMPPMVDGQPITAVGTMMHNSILQVVSHESNPIESAADLEGTTLGMGSVGGTSEKMLDLALADAGVDPESVDRQVVGVGPATFDLVRAGQLDGYIVSLDTAEAIAAANDDAVTSPAGLDGTPDVQTYVATPEYLEQSPETVKAFLAAIKEAVQFMIDDEDLDETLEILRSKYSFANLQDDAIAKAALETLRTTAWIGDGSTPLLQNSMDEWTGSYEILNGAGMVDDGDPTQWIELDLVE